MKETVAIIDAGGRGSVLVEKYSKSVHVKKIIAIPGNDLMQDNSDKPVQIFPEIQTTDIHEIIEICQREKVGLVDVAQDNAVAVGLANELAKRGIRAIGPTKEAGQIEWDKGWAREFGKRHNLPQPSYDIFSSQEEAIKFLEEQEDKKRYVKAGGLVRGKGAKPARNRQEAIQRVKEMSEFGKEGETFVIEDWMEGEEFSTFALVSGESVRILGSAQDYKKEKDKDEGENTGSMGSNSPTLLLNLKLEREVKDIFKNAAKGLSDERRPYGGILYLSGLVEKDKPKIVEWNARLGDPEAEVILPAIENDYFEIMRRVIEGNINKFKLWFDWKDRVAVVGAALGYPRARDYKDVIGKEIFGLREAAKVSGVTVYGAGVKRVDGRDYVAGGRLFYIVGEGMSLIEARQKAYEAMSLVSIDGNNLHFRTDIGWQDVKRLRKKSEF